MNLKTNIVLLQLVIAPIVISAQNFPTEFGQISNEEINLTQCEFDKNAEAIVLYDIGLTYFEEIQNKFNVIFERKTRIKILNEAGIKWAEIGIPYYQEGDINEKVYDIEATTYNFEHGKIIKKQLDLSNTYIEKKNALWNIKKFALPNVKVGSIIEFRYKINSQYKFNFRDWEFQWKIPVLYSEYVTKMIPFYEYTYSLQGATKFDVFEKYEDKQTIRQFGKPVAYGTNNYHDMVYKFVMKNIPAFYDEEFISSINDYIIKLDFQLSKINNLDGSDFEVLTNWKSLNETLIKHQNFGQYIRKSMKIGQDIFDMKTISTKSEIEKFNLVLDYMKTNYKWNNINQIFSSNSANNIHQYKIGNSADINLLTIGILHALNIEAYPIILSTRNNGKINYNYPFVDIFNYVIIVAVIEGNMIFADATDKLIKNNLIPTKCINGKGFLIKKNNFEWIDLECLFSSVKTTRIIINIEEKELIASISKFGTDYEDIELRKSYSANIEEIKKRISLDYNSLIDSSLTIENQDNKLEAFKIKYNIVLKPEVLNEKIYISPFLNESITKNPLKFDDRKYPIDFVFPSKKILISTISIPNGYKIEYAPENLKIENELFELNYTVKKFGNKIQIQFEYNFKKSIYHPSDFMVIKNYYEEILNKSNDKIVFAKEI